jgi:hypothetical protein
MVGCDATEWDPPVLCVVKVQIVAVLSGRRHGYHQLVGSVLEAGSGEGVGLVGKAECVALIGSVSVLLGRPIVQGKITQR